MCLYHTQFIGIFSHMALKSWQENVFRINPCSSDHVLLTTRLLPTADTHTDLRPSSKRVDDGKRAALQCGWGCQRRTSCSLCRNVVAHTHTLSLSLSLSLCVCMLRSITNILYLCIYIKRHDLLQAAIDDKIYSCGGLGTSDTINNPSNCAKYDPMRDKWSNKAQMLYPVDHAATGTDGSKMFVISKSH